MGFESLSGRLLLGTHQPVLEISKVPMAQWVGKYGSDARGRGLNLSKNLLIFYSTIAISIYDNFFPFFYQI